MTLRELRKHLRENTFAGESTPRASAKHVNSQLAVHVNHVMRHDDRTSTRLRLPSSDMPVLP
ncbi:hypothetical protein [Burkholderia multivorans]|uniref:hypothetical protein n=1 Tax=Burkholderia multivorans TaxID=87883 RepID=UPI000D01C9C5|nr:hypothetical protein [Burkholderia multivorans]PRH49745.1 hypothetical protein C6V05_03090 [Burkholderia multivorans]